MFTMSYNLKNKCETYAKFCLFIFNLSYVCRCKGMYTLFIFIAMITIHKTRKNLSESCPLFPSAARVVYHRIYIINLKNYSTNVDGY